jgi:hypothetical protein
MCQCHALKRGQTNLWASAPAVRRMAAINSAGVCPISLSPTQRYSSWPRTTLCEPAKSGAMGHRLFDVDDARGSDQEAGGFLAAMRLLEGVDRLQEAGYEVVLQHCRGYFLGNAVPPDGRPRTCTFQTVPCR